MKRLSISAILAIFLLLIWTSCGAPPPPAPKTIPEGAPEITIQDFMITNYDVAVDAVYLKKVEMTLKNEGNIPTTIEKTEIESNDTRVEDKVSTTLEPGEEKTVSCVFWSPTKIAKDVGVDDIKLMIRVTGYAGEPSGATLQILAEKQFSLPIPLARIGETITEYRGKENLPIALLWWKESNIAVNGPYHPDTYYTFIAKPGMKFIILAYEFKNTSVRAQETPYLSVGEIATTPEGYVYELWSPPLGVHSEEYNPRKATTGEIKSLIGDSGGYEDLLPEQSVIGRVVFEIPDDATPIEASIANLPVLIRFSAPPTTESTPQADQVQKELKVHFIDVGQGDAILVDLQDIEALIDGGDRSPGVVSYLKGHVDGALEVMIATHPHADHIGGLIDVLASFEVKEIWHNGDTSTSKAYSDFMSAVNAEKAKVSVAARGNVIEVDGLTFKVLNPANLKESTNNNSIVLHLAFGEIDFLFTGDTEQEAEAAMLIASDIPVPDVEILKVGHHGSRTASSQDFLAVTSPEVAIYMAATGNSYGHPHEETILNLNQVGAEIYGTDIHGSIIITTDGESYTLQLENIAAPVSSTVVSPPSPPTPTPTPSGVSNVQITRIFYDGLVPSVESDEYVEITNLGSESVDLAGWVLKDISEGYPSFKFPEYILEPGKSIRVYTDEIHPEYGGFSFGFGKAVWNNKSPDTATLYNAQGQEVSRKSY